jgi:hypothetical protein
MPRAVLGVGFVGSERSGGVGLGGVGKLTYLRASSVGKGKEGMRTAADMIVALQQER